MIREESGDRGAGREGFEFFKMEEEGREVEVEERERRLTRSYIGGVGRREDCEGRRPCNQVIGTEFQNQSHGGEAGGGEDFGGVEDRIIGYSGGEIEAREYKEREENLLLRH